jgi:hypothetical protein
MDESRLEEIYGGEPNGPMGLFEYNDAMQTKKELLENSIKNFTAIPSNENELLVSAALKEHCDALGGLLTSLSENDETVTDTVETIFSVLANDERTYRMHMSCLIGFDMDTLFKRTYDEERKDVIETIENTLRTSMSFTPVTGLHRIFLSESFEDYIETLEMQDAITAYEAEQEDEESRNSLVKKGLQKAGLIGSIAIGSFIGTHVANMLSNS